MPSYAKNFITQVVLRADFMQDTVPMAQPDETLLSLLDAYPVRNRLNRSKSEVRIRKTPQGPVKDTHTTNFIENNFWTEDRHRRVAVCSEYLFLEERRYEGYAELRDLFLDTLDAVAALYPNLKIRRFGMRYINEIKLPEEDAGPGLGADFWQQYVNPLLVGGLRFAGNDGTLARHMCSTELNYGVDRATLRYGIFNAEYPKPNQRREFILDVDTYCMTPMTAQAAPDKLDAFHTAACSVFETAITDALRARMSR
ncbi:MAG: TIGR04255 family protein [Oscillospiraceae bacterium]